MVILKLIQKDFKAHRLYWFGSMVLLLTLSSLFIYTMLVGNPKLDPEVIIYFMLMLLSTSFISLQFMKMDEVYKTNELYVSLPVSRTQIVIAKYLSSFTLVLMAIPIHYLGFQLGMWFYGSAAIADINILYNPILWLTMGFILLFFKCFSYPLYFMFGLSKGLAIQGVIQFLLLVMLILSSRVFNLQLLFNKFIGWFSDQNSYLVLFISGLTFMGLMTLSVIISSRIFKQKAL